MSFLTPLFLAAAGAALLPVLLHLVRRMKAKEVPFSSLMFLQATPMERIRRRKLRDILLLVLRMAMIVLLATAFARPYLVHENLPFVPQRTNESMVILVDQSMSMQAGDTFNRVLEALTQLIAEANPDDELALVGFSDRATQLAPLTRDHDRIRASIGALALTNQATDYHPAFQLAENILEDARHSARRVALISDLQQRGFTPSMVEYALPEGVVFMPIQVGSGEIENRYFDDFARTERRRGDQTVTRLDARHHALSADETIRLMIEGQEVDSKPATAEGLGPVSFQHIAPRAGLYQGHLALDSDPLESDNRYYFTYAVKAQPSILAISADDDAFFLRSAFELAEQSLFDFSRGVRIAGATLLSHDVVFVANPIGLSQPQAAALRTFAEAGGSVVLSFGKELARTGAGIDLLGAGAITEVVQTRGAFIGKIDTQHSIFATLASSSALIRPKIRSYVRIAPEPGTTVIGQYDNGDPFLMERRAGQGTILIYTSSFGTSWSDLALHELFVPLLYQITTYATTLGDRPQQFTVGEPVSLSGAPEDTWDVMTPDGSVYKVDIDSSGIGYFRETAQPGHYAAALRNDSYAFSVNVDPTESILTTRGVEETYAAIAGGRSDIAETPQEAVISSEKAEQERSLWRLAVLAVLGLFVLETFLAHRNRKTNQ